MTKYEGRIIIQFQINNSDGVDAKMLLVSGDQKEAEIIKKEILSIIDGNLFTYVSAKNKGVNVDL